MALCLNSIPDLRRRVKRAGLRPPFCHGDQFLLRRFDPRSRRSRTPDISGLAVHVSATRLLQLLLAQDPDLHHLTPAAWSCALVPRFLAARGPDRTISSCQPKESKPSAEVLPSGYGVHSIQNQRSEMEESGGAWHLHEHRMPAHSARMPTELCLEPPAAARLCGRRSH